MRVRRANELKFEPASHEDPTAPGVIKKVFFKREDVPGGQLQMVNWARLPKGSSFRAHYHEDMAEIFIIINGRVELKVAGQVCELNAGDAVLIPERSEHVMKNLVQEDVNYIAMGISRGLSGKTVVTGN